MGINLKAATLIELDGIKDIVRDAQGVVRNGLSRNPDEILERALDVVVASAEVQELVNIICDQNEALRKCVSDAGDILSCYWGDDGVIDVEKMSEWIARASESRDSSLFRPAFFIELIEKAGQVALDKSMARHLSNAGASGGKAKHKPTDDLKAWALEQAKTLKGSDGFKADRLSAMLPTHLADASKHPRQLIYRALLKSHTRKTSR